MSAFDRLEFVQEELDEIMIDVLHGVLGEEAAPSWDPLPYGPSAAAKLLIHDEVTDEYASVEVRVGADLALVLAGRMMFVAEPELEDVLDAVAELGNICGGQVKTLLCQHGRLSLPSADISGHQPPLEPSGVQVRAVVLGHVVELTVTPGLRFDGLLWPPVQEEEAGSDDALERQP